jgi:5-hydroxyisourate hydrolase-like protein (transthyretin family)
MRNKTHLLLLAALALMLLPGFASEVRACSCMFGGASPCEEYWQTDAVFAGTVVGSSEIVAETAGYQRRLVRFSVEESFRGVEGAFVEVVTGLGGGDCGYGFKQGGQYLVYAHRDGKDKRLHTSICSRTRPLDKAVADLAFMRGLGAAPPLGVIFGSVSKRNHEWKEGEDWRKGVGGAELTIEGEGARHELKSNAQGEFRIEGLAPGAYKVRLKIPPGLAQLDAQSEFLETTAQEMKVFARGCAQAEFLLDSDTRVSGHVIDASAQPAANLRLELRGAPSDRKNINTLLYAHTDAAGRFEFKLVPPGDYLFGVRLLGSYGAEPTPYPRTYYPGVTSKAQATVVSVREGEQVRELELRLLPRLAEYAVDGLVVWADGRPAPGVNVYVSLEEEGEPSSHTSLRADERGRFTLKVYEGLSYKVSASRPDATGAAAQSNWVEVPPPGAQPIKLVLPITRSSKAKTARPD